jgi:phage tail protein X
MSVSRYQNLISDGDVAIGIPFFDIPIANSDLTIVYNKRTMRMDTLSYKYYGDANYGWLILQANPQYSGFEFSIPNGVKLRIPYPFNSAIDRYETSVRKNK